jgi:hypothetical protein
MQSKIEAGEYVRPCDGERQSGDAAFVQFQDDGVLIALVDVLGHGKAAHALAVSLTEKLYNWLREVRKPSPDLALAALHEAARGTRGAVASVAWIDVTTLEGNVTGIGNVRCRLFGSVAKTIKFDDGLLGFRVRSRMPVPLALMPADVLLLFSDGVSERFDASQYPTLTLDPAPTIAFNIVQRFGKGRDDASCAVLRCKP